MEHGLNLQQALDLPRVISYLAGVEVERGVPPATVAALRAMGHTIVAAERSQGRGQAIWVDHARGCPLGAS